jgi:signal transduction histidine kinase/CheY-like chemotaxis protein
VHERDTLAFLAETSELFAGVLDVDAVVSTLGRMPVPFFADALLVHVVLEDGTMRCAAGHQLGAGSREQVARVIGTVVAVDDCLLARAVASGRHELCPDIRVGDYWRLFGPGEGEGLARDLEVRAAVFVPLVGEGGTMAVVSYLSSTDGKLTSADAPMIEDLTRRFRLLLERVRLYREAHDANRLKDEFLTTLSHELRTPLNAILGWAKVLRTRPLDERILHPLEVIERNAAAQARLVEEILDVSRIMTGKLHLEVAPVDLQAVIRAAIDAIGPEAQARELQIIEHVDAAEAAVNGDAHRLQQVVWNLLSNAVKFTEPGGAITVRLVRADDGFQVCVTDTGEGIAEQDLPFVFDRFRQADASTTRHHGGLGLGLAIVRYMVELHGGSVTASSPGVGQGATFTVYLPSPGVSGRPALTEGTAAVRDEREPSVSTRRRPLSGRRVLVVEDNDDTRELIVEMLEAAGASVTAAATSRNAFDAFTNALPDAVVADIGLPGEDGYALMRRIRALPGNAGGFVPAVAVTAYVRMEDRKQALAAGFQQHVAKPVDPVQLVDAIASML